ncbi:hypothetical protein [Methylobacterium sp. CM6246]
MYCDLRSETHPKVIMRKPTGRLKELPLASEVNFPGVFAWSVVSSPTVTAALGVDPGSWNVWRNRRLTPAPLPRVWFRRATGSPLIYQVSDVLVWLAAKRGEQLDPLTTWRLSLARDFGTKTGDPPEIRRLAVMYARAVGPAIGGVRFTTAGFQTYLASLLSSS